MPKASDGWMLEVLLVLLLLAGAVIGVLAWPELVRAQQPPGTLGPQGRFYYYQGGPPVRLYDGGTGGHSAPDARRFLEVPWRNGYDEFGASWNMSGSLVTPYTLATDSSWFFRNSADTTKKVKLRLGLLTTARTSTWIAQNVTSCNVPCMESANTWTGVNAYVGSIAGYPPVILSGQGLAPSPFMSVIDDDNVKAGRLFWRVSSGGRDVWFPDRGGSLALLEDLGTAGLGIYDPLLRVKDSQLWIKNVSDTTKKLQLNLANLATATTRTDSVPDVSTMLAGLGAANNFRSAQTIAPATDVVPLKLQGDGSFGGTANLLELNDGSGIVGGVDAGGTPTFNSLAIGTVGGTTSLTISNKSAITTARNYKLDNTIASTDFCMTGGTQTVNGAKTLSGACVVTGGTALNVDGTTSHTYFRDHTSTTKAFAFNASQLTAGSTRVDTLPDISGQMVVRPNARDFTAQTANIAPTDICTTPPIGMYRVSVYGVTTALLGAGITITLGWTDPQQAQTATANLGTAVGSYATMEQPVRVASGSITISTSGYVTGTYSIYCRVEGPL